MTKGFQQQDPMTNFCIPRVEPVPQHGQKADKLCKKIKERRIVAPQPAEG